MERHTRTKAEKEYIKGLIQNLSLQRLTDQEIVDYLHDEKQIEIGRSTVTRTRNELEKQAGNWYVDLRKSAYKYIAAYKHRMDSLLSYQKRLHEIISTTKKDEVKIRAISELHSIEMDIYNLWKQIPNLEVSEPEPNQEEEKESKPMTFDQWFTKDYTGSYVGKIGDETDEENGKYYRDIQKKYNEYVKDWQDHMFGIDNDSDSELNAEWTVDDKKPKPNSKPALEKPIAATIVSSMEELEDKEKEDEWPQLQCSKCHKSFYNNFTLSAHICHPNAA